MPAWGIIELPERKDTNDDNSSRPATKATLSRSLTPTSTLPATFDIEHAPVENDPRQWSRVRKNLSLLLIASASMIAGLAASIQNPAIREMETELPATSGQFSLSIALFILLQGGMPLFWSAISEVEGRKLVYIASLFIFMVGSIIVAISSSIGLVIGFRCVQAIGSSAVIAIGAATLADIFEPAERGTKMGMYYMAPLLGPALGPIFGGVLTSGFNWRAIFWFLTIVSGTSTVSFVLFFKDTFRRERSLVYQNALKKNASQTEKSARQDSDPGKDAEKAVPAVTSAQEIRPSITDVNPIQPICMVLRRKNNLVVLVASGLQFAFAFFIPYTSARTLSARYDYEALHIGLVTLCYGAGSIVGSLLGGRWSDYQLARLKVLNQGVSQPEMRLYSTVPGLILLPPFTVGFGWLCEKHAHVSALCVFLFMCGFMAVWVYSSTLAYVVDANTGRSSTATATNSAFRGLFAFIATEVAVPIQDNLGDGWTYTIWGGLLVLVGVLLVLVLKKGRNWRETGEASERT
ncbi:hypothetical protein CC1G_15077 [Coprinopsis cinerea okayama7|uniref:Major facilitator superfamily (MFS) profile domain-containing protein n=1 Tax=Coprinopsis cinerea (strain Okayama-7 / 130 / ATCC MYA-4618 / FGSC 9003) TaxID=240176 RepID=D6RP91_COPC7|nr:hypothetical protein CC1G_15077 [Coprinopsis cinerea okayama7\|eukprot:XP_002910743.1 hypothetical protein CC1G_15077 [Coprinopsis cinerea okayama7\